MDPGLTRRELLAAGAAGAAAAAGCGFGRDDGPDGFAKAANLDEIPPDGMKLVSLVDDRLPPEVARFRVYLRRDGDDVVAIDARCTHLGCPVRYVEASERFICPCHGGVFDRAGRAQSGPPRHPLARRDTRVADGVVYVGPADVTTFEIPGRRES